ncbi:MAG TPA: TetR family transcriptional regulator [Solirubrobacteraceae bacterium]|nr:TetR family transcriptional regulator [Solirubrobacteraceae bacterium]
MPRPAATRRRASGGYAPEETRQAIIDSALRLFGAQGYAATSVQEITDAAGVTKGAFYHHFESKEDLLRLIHDEFLDYQLAILKVALDRETDPDTRLRDLLRALLESTARYMANVTIFYQERRHLTGARFKAIKRKRDEFDRLFRDVIQRGVQEGVFRDDLDSRIVGLGILGMCAWVHQWYRPDGRLSAEQIADIFSEMAIDGLTVNSRSSR